MKRSQGVSELRGGILKLASNIGIVLEVVGLARSSGSSQEPEEVTSIRSGRCAALALGAGRQMAAHSIAFGDRG